MTKKKKKVEQKKSTYGNELIGMLLILISIIGLLSNTGPVGKFIREFSIFLVGTWYGVLLFLIMVIGGYMIIKREKPDFFTSKLIGLYVFIISILILSHLEYLNSHELVGLDIITETFDRFMSQSSSHVGNMGGGLIGASISVLFLKLFELRGTKIVTYVLLICGLMMFTGKSIYDVIIFIRDKARFNITTKEIEEEKPKKKKKKLFSKDKTKVEEEEIVSYEESIEKTQQEYGLPSMELLKEAKNSKNKESAEIINHNVNTLHQVLRDFGIEGKVVAIHPGPTVTQYEIETKSGTKVSKILGINREIALALAAKDVRIEAPIPGKSTIGIEIPNRITTPVCVREILERPQTSNKLAVVLGKNIMGKPMWAEINKTPHLLVAGSTGSGKSVCINSFIISILMRAQPKDVRLVLIDPKKVEFAMYEGIPHLLAPVVTDASEANNALKQVVKIMEERYEKFKATGTKNIESYNEEIDRKNAKHPDNKQAKMPYIVVIIDELADLMLVAAKEVEDSIMRITQMARAAGIHLIVATQRPSTDVITGVVKANIPARISFAVASAIDSRTILGMMGAEKLIGKGDMLYLPQDQNTPVRIQGTFITDEEIKKVVEDVKKKFKNEENYDNKFAEAIKKVSQNQDTDASDEPRYDEVVEYVMTQEEVSISQLQRQFRFGYNRAARAVDLLEARGIVGPSTNSGKKRKVLAHDTKDDE